MRILHGVALAALLGTAPVASADPVARCAYGEAGRVVTVGDTTVALCAHAGPCPGWVGVYATANGEALFDTCTDTHIDGFESLPCALMVRLQPGVPGVVDIGWDGDTEVDGYPVLECYPFWD